MIIELTVLEITLIALAFIAGLLWMMPHMGGWNIK